MTSTLTASSAATIAQHVARHTARIERAATKLGITPSIENEYGDWLRIEWAAFTVTLPGASAPNLDNDAQFQILSTLDLDAANPLNTFVTVGANGRTEERLDDLQLNADALTVLAQAMQDAQQRLAGVLDALG